MNGRRLGYAVLGAVAPGLAGRRAADAFTHTRLLGVRPDDLPPLGARRFAVAGVPGVRGGYLWGGDGPTALLVHGFGSDSSSMYGLVPALRERGLRVAAFDAPGHGVSAGSRTTMTAFTRSVSAVLDTLGDVRVIVAHSMGAIATVAALAEGTHPPVDRLVLLAPAATFGGVLERWARGRPELSRADVDRIHRELHRRDGVPVSHWDVARLGTSVGCPVLAIHDPYDAVVPYGDAERVAAGLRARLVPAPGRGHQGVLTSPDVRGTVGDFVTSVRNGEAVG